MTSARNGIRAVSMLGVAALALVAVACGGGVSGDDDDNDGGMQAALPGGVTGAPSGEDRSESAGDNSGAYESEGAATDDSALTLDRKIIFTGGITLSVDNVGSRFGEVSRLATAAGGFVERSSFANGDDDEGARSATLTLRVPADRYEDTLASLRGLQGATVKNESSNSSEVTEQYTDLQSRLRNLERTEQQYLSLLERAQTIPDILTVQDRLDGVRLQIEQIQGRLKVLDDAVDLATIDVTLLSAPLAKADDGNGGPKSVSEAFSGAWAWFVEATKYVMAGAAVLAVAAIFLGVPAGLVAAIAVVLSRRRGATAA